MFRLTSEYCISRNSVNAIEGECFHLNYCLDSTSHNHSTTPIKWYKNATELSSNSSTRIIAHNNNLEFWPIELDDSGVYELHTGNNILEITINVFRKSENSCYTEMHVTSQSVEVGNALNINCKYDYDGIQNNRTVLYKNCSMMENYGNNSSQIQISKNAEFMDQGYYTCSFSFSHNGKLWNTTRTYNITITEHHSVINPALYGQHPEYVEVVLGKNILLNCSATKNKESVFYWNFETNESNVHEESEPQTQDDEDKRLVSKILRIETINKGNLNTKYNCVLSTTKRTEIKTFILVQKEMDDIPGHIFTRGMITVIFISVAVVCLVILSVIYRVDLALFYRYLMRRDETLTDGKTYDAFVSYLKECRPENGEEHTFAVEILPRVLEKHFGYKLCIFERDVMPGRAVVDEIHSLIEKSRRLIILLSKNYMSSEVRYELESGLHEALVERKIKVILIKFTSVSDFTFLPQSLELLKSHRVLKWKADKSLSYNSRFWKNLLYLMPAKVVKPYKGEIESCPFIDRSSKKCQWGESQKASHA